MTDPDPPPPAADTGREAALRALAQPRRMAPIAVVLGFGSRLRSALRQFGLVLAFALFRSGGRAALALLAVGLLITAGASILSWLRFTYRVERGELVAEQGVISQRRIAVPIGRIQGVSVDQQLTHRVLDVVRVAVDTAGSADDEIVLDAVPRETAHQLRLVVLGSADRPHPEIADDPTPADDGPVLLRRAPRDLTVVALTRSPFRFLGAAVGSLVALSSSLDDFVDPEDVGRAVQDYLPGTSTVFLAVLVSLGAVIGLSILGVHLRYHDLELRLTARGLRTTSGLIERRERIAPLARIQRIRWSANPIQRRLELSSVAIDQAHAGPTAEGVTGGVRLPGTRPAELAAILDLHLPKALRPHDLDRRLPRAVIQRTLGFVGAGSAATLAAGLLVGGLGWWTALVVTGAVLIGASQVLGWRSFRWGLSSSVIEVAQGPFLRRTTLVQLRKVQTAATSRGLFDRRQGLATVVLTTASGAVRLPHIELETARALRDHTLAVVESSDQPWM